MKADTDIIVVGGGLAGLASAVSLARSGHRVIHLAPPAPPDRRTSALMMPSVDFLRQSGLIGEPADLGHALTAIRIIDATPRLIRAPETLFDAAEIGLSAFGWNFANAALLARFQEAAPSAGFETRSQAVTAWRRDGDLGVVTLSDGTELQAPLVVGADGKKSLLRSVACIATREHHFAEAALVCDLDLARPIGGASIEFHYPRGPFTLVPAGGTRANLVWIDEEAKLRQLQSEGPDRLLAALHERAQRLFGTMTLASPSFVFPLSTLTVETAGRDGVALVGESAHAFPPIGAQGLNLGLRDAADLVAAVDAADRTDPAWGIAASQDYAARRAGDLARTGGMVDALFRSLLAEMLPSQALRAGGLWALKLLPPLRRQAFALGMGER
ncbi:2-octaprenyl-6-methoxyphenol hydroxylase [Devosia lucknowensis]|uniref:2-octaprenyl-6-methoxyphenol hydroxylase n=1 Tax=Devosia lucknowensis TaxID=1096929 RepID=A0A1Y6EWG9_9HYPH|nr:FAD-dependent monooxygenase [Devosia lucknowensis]SMQ65290.1 2-octaprenyl-6-methoxyphenol hydroxylase [Devosia lucknowensis]